MEVWFKPLAAFMIVAAYFGVTAQPELQARILWPGKRNGSFGTDYQRLFDMLPSDFCSYPLKYKDEQYISALPGARLTLHCENVRMLSKVSGSKLRTTKTTATTEVPRLPQEPLSVLVQRIDESRVSAVVPDYYPGFSYQLVCSNDNEAASHGATDFMPDNATRSLNRGLHLVRYYLEAVDDVRHAIDSGKCVQESYPLQLQCMHHFTRNSSTGGEVGVSMEGIGWSFWSSFRDQVLPIEQVEEVQVTVNAHVTNVSVTDLQTEQILSSKLYAHHARLHHQGIYECIVSSAKNVSAIVPPSSTNTADDGLRIVKRFAVKVRPWLY